MGHEKGGWMNADQRDSVRDEWDDYETKSPEGRLRLLAKHYGESLKEHGSRDRFFEGRLVELTIDMDEHPEWFGELEYPCCCRECCSNA